MFWEVNWNNQDRSLPTWLQGWWEVYDGNTYYYYFADQPGAFYTSIKPSDPNMPPMLASPKNYATVEMNAHGPTLSWTQVDNNPSTVETFTRLDWTSCTDMNGVSNNFGPLYAKKIEQVFN